LFIIKEYLQGIFSDSASVPEAFCAEEICKVKAKQPAAVKLPLGWSLIGPASSTNNEAMQVNFMRMQEDSLHEQLQSLWKTDFADTQCNGIKNMSEEDICALNVMERCVNCENGHYVMPLLWYRDAPELPSNRIMTFNRLVSLKRRLQRDQDDLVTILRLQYDDLTLATILLGNSASYIENGYAREVPVESIPGDVVWYLPHHAVKHSLKGKARVVFNCAAKKLLLKDLG